MAATFDRDLIREAGNVTGKESRAFANAVGKGGHCRLAPTVDLCRDPRWGRTEEGYGEETLANIAGRNLWNLLKRAEREAVVR